MKKTHPTAAEQEERAKDGWFYEFSLKQWIHVSRVETREKAREFVKKINPFRLWLLAWNPLGDVWTEYTGIALWCSKHFCWPAGTALLLGVFGIVGLILNSSLLCNVVMVLQVLCIVPYGFMAIQDRKAAINDVAECLYINAAALKTGIYYDEYGNMRRFQKRYRIQGQSRSPAAGTQ